MPRHRLVVLVNGVPGSGKSTLARPLARALDLPLFAKDVIKETWADFLGAAPLDGKSQREWSQLLGSAASQTMWNLLSDSPCGGVIDSPLTATMRHHVDAGVARARVPRPLEIWCDISPELARRRCVERQRERHRIHGQHAESAEPIGHPGPLGIGPVFRVDTSTAVRIEPLVAWCREQSPTA